MARRGRPISKYWAEWSLKTGKPINGAAYWREYARERKRRLELWEALREWPWEWPLEAPAVPVDGF